MRGNAVLKEKVEELNELNAFFSSAFISNANCSQAPLVGVWSLWSIGS